MNPLLAANLRREGVDARVLEEDAVGIRKAMRHNTGQCLPLNIIAQETIDYVKKHGLDPAKTAVWMPRSTLSCSIGMFLPFLKSLMEAEGGGMERVEVYAGDMFYLEISRRAAVNCYKAYLAGGLLRRVGCRLRPYEVLQGATDRAIARAMEILIPAFEGTSRKDEALRSAAGVFDAVSITAEERRPRVAIFGDLYVRDNDVMNQGLIRAIEGAGGEAVTTPYTEYVRIIAESYFRKWSLAGAHFRSLTYRALWLLADTMGSRCRLHFERFLDPEREVTDTGSELFLREFGLRPEHAGESFDNLMKIFHLARVHPELALFVQASPAFCCPSMVTEAMARDIERLTGVPVVSITYDGTGQYQNDAIVPYIRFAAQKVAEVETIRADPACAWQRPARAGDERRRLVYFLSLSCPGGYLWNMGSIYSIVAKDIDGKDRSMSEFTGKVLLIVNVASRCDWTPQYKSLQTMYARYRDRGFAVLAFPSDSFGRQEPGTDAEIKSFCSSTYGVSFPLFSKTSVKGRDMHPLFAWLTEKETNPQFPGKVTEGFNKFLVNRKGAVVARFDSKDDPMGDKIPRMVGIALDQ